MKVKDLIKLLSGMPKNANVVYMTDDGNGCDTCGYGSSESERDVDGARACDDGKTVRLTGY